MTLDHMISDLRMIRDALDTRIPDAPSQAHQTCWEEAADLASQAMRYLQEARNIDDNEEDM